MLHMYTLHTYFIQYGFYNGLIIRKNLHGYQQAFIIRIVVS